MSKHIKIVCNSGLNMSINDINNFQGELKELPDDRRANLRHEIESTGFAFAPHVWLNQSDKKYYLVDGHQRIAVLRDMIADGFECPNIPVVEVKAASIEDAKIRVLQAIAQYGLVTNQGLYEFTATIKDIQERLKTINIPDFSASKFMESYYPQPTNEPEPNLDGSAEIEQGQFTKLVHTCPRCGFAFGAE